MDKDILRKVQLIQLEITKDIVRVCEKNDIAYFLIGGTLLGAIRHKGFIPWDDDMDIGMLRTDYEKFIEIAPKELNHKYELVNWKNDEYYPHPMAKVVKKGTVFRENKRKDKGKQGIWVDIFPYDYCENSEKKCRKRFFELKAIRALIRAKCKYQTWTTCNGIDVKLFIKNIPFRIAAILFDKSMLIKKYECISMQVEKSCWVYENGTENFGVWKFPIECLKKRKKVDFEGESFFVPELYDEYLKKAYGDYMKLPPLKDRENRHNIVELKFGDENVIDI